MRDCETGCSDSFQTGPNAVRLKTDSLTPIMQSTSVKQTWSHTRTVSRLSPDPGTSEPLIESQMHDPTYESSV